MVVIVWTGWKGRMGQLWTWIYTAWPWLTVERPYFWSKKPRCRGSKKLAGSMCIRMHARRFARTTRIYQRDEPAQWQLSRGPMQACSERAEVPACLQLLILSLEPMFYLDRIYAPVHQASGIFLQTWAGLGLVGVYTRVQQLINRVLCHRETGRLRWLPNDFKWNFNWTLCSVLDFYFDDV